MTKAKLENASPKVSVIVPVYNGEQFLDRCLDAILNSAFRSIELIVVDDQSTDDSAGIARRKGAKVMTMDKRSGPAGARNFAAEEAKGEILVFVDADVVIKSDTLQKIVSKFDARMNLAALFGSYDDEPAEPNFLSQYKNLSHHYVHQISSPEAWTFWAGLGAIRRSVFLEIKGFDCKRFQIPSIEDIELGARLRDANHEILLARDIQGKHLKKWEPYSLIYTDVFCRALPWSRLIVTSQGLKNDMNLRTSDRLSVVLVGLLIALIPFLFWAPTILVIQGLILLILILLNKDILSFFWRIRGLTFAAKAFPWILIGYLYSGTVFAYCLLRYGVPATLGLTKPTKEETSEI